MNLDFTDLIDTMDQRLAVMQADIDAALDAHQTLTRARNLLADTNGTAKASHWPALVDAATTHVTTAANPAAVKLTAAKTTPTAKATTKAAPKGRHASMQAAAAVRVSCPECGKECSALGVGTHRTRAHGYRASDATTAPTQPVAPVDNSRRTFSPDDATALLEAM